MRLLKFHCYICPQTHKAVAEVYVKEDATIVSEDITELGKLIKEAYPNINNASVIDELMADGFSKGFAESTLQWDIDSIERDTKLEITTTGEK